MVEKNDLKDIQNKGGAEKVEKNIAGDLGRTLEGGEVSIYVKLLTTDLSGLSDEEIQQMIKDMDLETLTTTNKDIMSLLINLLKATNEINEIETIPLLELETTNTLFFGNLSTYIEGGYINLTTLRQQSRQWNSFVQKYINSIINLLLSKLSPEETINITIKRIIESFSRYIHQYETNNKGHIVIYLLERSLNQNIGDEIFPVNQNIGDEIFPVNPNIGDKDPSIKSKP